MNYKKILISATLALSAASLIGEALARPMGGGKSIGRQSQSVNNMPRQATPPAAPPASQATQPARAPGAATPPAVAPKPASPWKGILGGALLGLGLGALLSHFGLGGALASALSSILMIALLAGAAFLIWRLIRSKMAPKQPQLAPAGFSNNNAWQPQPAAPAPAPSSDYNLPPLQPVQPAASGLNLAKPGDVPAAAHAPWGVPADFDAATFLRHAKGNFIRLQAAWDKADVADIREFTTPEVFAELKMQISERGGQADFTDVVTIEAEMLGIENDGRDYLASVKFYGTIKSSPTALAEPFQEVWNLSKPVSGNAGWLLAGIQQLA
ncbi:MAG: 39S ribosomal protein L45 [Burkholderiaceae bacterium]|nr:39S ribosomal protein L45 [Burkholderiaceae bacterium]